MVGVCSPCGHCSRIRFGAARLKAGEYFRLPITMQAPHCVTVALVRAWLRDPKWYLPISEVVYVPCPVDLAPALWLGCPHLYTWP